MINLRPGWHPAPVERDTPAWVARRGQRLGVSEIPSVLGVQGAPQSPGEVWRLKVEGARGPAPDPDWRAIGHGLEAGVALYLREQHEADLAPCPSLEHEELPLVGTPDLAGTLRWNGRRRRVGVEVKTAFGSGDLWGEGEGESSPSATLQGGIYTAEAINVDLLLVAVALVEQVGARTFRPCIRLYAFEVEALAAIAARAVAAGLEWWRDYVVARTPCPDAAASVWAGWGPDRGTIRAATADEDALAARLLDVRERLGRLEAERDVYADDLARLCAGAEVKGEGWRARPITVSAGHCPGCGTQLRAGHARFDVRRIK